MDSGREFALEYNAFLILFGCSWMTLDKWIFDKLENWEALEQIDPSRVWLD